MDRSDFTACASDDSPHLVSDHLLLPSTGIVALPLVGLHAWMLPLSPTAFVAFVPKESSLDALDRLLAKPTLLTLLSGNVENVPPALREPPASA